jgi:hypothetical protein
MGTHQRRRFAFEHLESRQLLAADPIITEFMASNRDSLEDGDGASPDWIEIYNNGDQALDLAAYRLTDDAAVNDKWVFPNVVLDAGEFLLVFASGNNTPDSAGNLHTNFALSDDGEYLALIDPMGVVLSEFNPGGEEYPPQAPDVSYGLAMDAAVIEAVSAGTAAKYILPTNSSVDATWTQHEFNDSAWTNGTASLGYENTAADFAGLIQTTLPTATTSAYVRMSFAVTNGDASLDKLRMKYDDGFIAYINGVRVASANAPAVAAYNSIATADHPDPLAIEYVDFDLREYAGSLREGANTLAIHLLNRSPSSDMLMVPSLVLTTGSVIEPRAIGRLASPTPGSFNTNLRAADAAFSRDGGLFVAPFQLTMTAGAGETIRYTTDGSNPNEFSPIYSGPITINSSQQIRARSFGPEGQVGATHASTYVKTTAAVASVTSDLPIIVLENLSGGVPDREFQDSSFTVYDVDPTTGMSSLAGPADLSTLSAQHRRGKSTYSQPKLNLRIELRDTVGADASHPLLGMPSESDWILYAPWTIDRAMVRHSLMYDLSRQMGRWAPRTRYVEVYSNYDGGDLTASDYVGVYVLMEVIKRDDNRVDIDELTPTQSSAPAITGGYILQIDEPETNDASWSTSRGYPRGGSQFIHVEPERVELSQAQVAYIRDYVQDAEDALFGSNFTDPVQGYQAYFDVDAAIDFHILNVFAANPDAFRLSTYLTKDRGGKLAFGPIWDFDRGMGPDEDDRAADPTKWMSDEAYLWVTQYWNRLFDDPNFEQRWVDRWQELRSTVFSEANLQATLASHTSQLSAAQARNAARWGGGIAPNGGPLADPGLNGWEGEISHLENWLLARVNWIDTQMISAPVFGVDPGFVAVNSSVTLSSPPGTSIFYTLDGSDPRADGGGIRPGAMLYTGPISIAQTTTITARARGAGDFFGGWSGDVAGLFSVEAPANFSNLRITELHYHPANATPAELTAVPGADDNDFEFVELTNISQNPISLNGVKFVEGIGFDFSLGSVASLDAGESVIVVSREAAFVARYGAGLTIAGEYTGRLSNGGEQIVLRDGSDQLIHDFTYSDDAPWPTAADGGGPSLEVMDTSGDYSSAFTWVASLTSSGTPGTPTLRLPGDFNGDGFVNLIDYNLWRSNYGAVSGQGLLADGNRDGRVDAADYTVWRDNVGTQLPPSTADISLSTASQLEAFVSAAEAAEVRMEEFTGGYSQFPPTAAFPSIERTTPSVAVQSSQATREDVDLALLLFSEQCFKQLITDNDGAIDGEHLTVSSATAFADCDFEHSDVIEHTFAISFAGAPFRAALKRSF